MRAKVYILGICLGFFLLSGCGIMYYQQPSGTDIARVKVVSYPFSDSEKGKERMVHFKKIDGLVAGYGKNLYEVTMSPGQHSITLSGSINIYAARPDYREEVTTDIDIPASGYYILHARSSVKEEDFTRNFVFYVQTPPKKGKVNIHLEKVSRETYEKSPTQEKE